MDSPVPTVFVVDDDASVRRALARLLTSLGLGVEAFTGAEEFFARDPRGEHGCILLDIKMPKMTGLDLQRQLRVVGIEMPVIFMSALADVPLTARAMKAGAVEVLTKPFREDALLDAVRRAIALDDARHREPAEDRSFTDDSMR